MVIIFHHPPNPTYVQSAGAGLSELVSIGDFVMFIQDNITSWDTSSPTGKSPERERKSQTSTSSSV